MLDTWKNKQIDIAKDKQIFEWSRNLQERRTSTQPVIYQSPIDAMAEVDIPKGDPDVFDPKSFKTDYFLFKNSSIQLGPQPKPSNICNDYSVMQSSLNNSPNKELGITSDL